MNKNPRTEKLFNDLQIYDNKWTILTDFKIGCSKIEDDLNESLSLLQETYDALLSDDRHDKNAVENKIYQLLEKHEEMNQYKQIRNDRLEKELKEAHDLIKRLNNLCYTKEAQQYIDKIDSNIKSAQ